MRTVINLQPQRKPPGCDAVRHASVEARVSWTYKGPDNYRDLAFNAMRTVDLAGDVSMQLQRKYYLHTFMVKQSSLRVPPRGSKGEEGKAGFRKNGGIY